MKITAIKEGERARRFTAEVSSGPLGAVIVSTGTGDGTWGASFLTNEGVTICRALEWPSNGDSLCWEYEFVVDSGTDIVLVDSSRSLARALKRCGVDQQELLGATLEAIC